MALVTFSIQQAIKEISLNNQKKFNQIAQEVEDYEISKLLGYAFLQTIIDNKTDYKDLLEGCSFVDCHGNTVKHKGLYYVIAYLNYSTYIAESQVTDTFTGMVQKNREDSIQISSGVIKNLQHNAREIAFNAFDLIKMYLNLSTDIKYKLWFEYCKKVTKKHTVFYGVKATSSNIELKHKFVKR